MLNSYDNTISDNKILSSNRTGIELFPYGDGNLISNNTIESSGKGGIALYTIVSGGDIVSDNVVKENGFGIYVSSNSKITGNKIVSNDDYGIKLQGINDVIVRGNYIEDNGQGICIESASDNAIYHNDFINNTDQVASYASLNQWHGRWNVTGNYWSDYNGTDSDGDGIGDSPYVINANNVDYNPLMNPYLPGDVNHSGQVDIYDVVTVSIAYGSYPGHPKWNPHADINEDAIIDSEDMDIVMANFGKTWQEYWGV